MNPFHKYCSDKQKFRLKSKKRKQKEYLNSALNNKTGEGWAFNMEEIKL